MDRFDLIIIGAGPGGYEAALYAAKEGLSTALIEKDKLGGTCLNRGCIPTKTLLHTSELYEDLLKASQCGINASGVELSLNELYSHKDKVVSTLRDGIAAMMKKNKVTVINGVGKIVSKSTVSVTGDDGNESLYEADNIMIATGSVPARPPIPGIDLPGVMTSDELLKTFDEIPDSIIIIGGGVIGIEFAQFLSDIGKTVTVVEGLERILPMMDKEVSQNLNMMLKKKGVTIHTGAMVNTISYNEPSGDMEVRFTAKGEEKTVSAGKVLCSIGRMPYTEGLFDETLGIEMDRRKIKVNENYETSVKGIYAIGDVSSRIQLAHVATAQGLACVDHILGKEDNVNMSIVPSCVYTRPEIACVGITQEEAAELKIGIKTGKCVLGGNARTLVSGVGRSFIKVIADAENNEILGAVMMCERATDMITQFSIAIANGLTADDMLKTMRPHPTFEEAVAESLRSLL